MTDEQRHHTALSKLKARFIQWNKKRKALFGGLLIIAAAAVLTALLLLIEDDEYRLLYANLVPEDYLAISNFLNIHNINYKENQDQRSLYIPSGRVDMARLELASLGLPSSSSHANDLVGSRGLAFIDSLAGGDSRTLVQHELSRTLSALDQIQSARVQLELPSEDDLLHSRPGATVILSLTPGRSLTPDQLHTVIHLVSTSVTGLEFSDVKVFDSSGKLLTGPSKSGDGVLFTDATLSYQRAVEHSLEQKAQGLVDAMIGKGQALIKISASLDFSRNEITSESFSPDDAVVRSEQIERQPVTESESAGLSGQTSGPRYRSSVTTSSKVDYEISKTTSKTIRPYGELKQLSVTILVADKKKIGDDGTVNVQPRSEADLEEIESLVAGVLSLKPERGDSIHLSRVAAEHFGEPQRSAEISLFYKFIDLIPVSKIIFIFFVFGLLYLLLLKPIIGLLRSEMDLTDRDSPAPVGEEMMDSISESLEEDIAAKLIQDVQSNPLATAHIIRKWIQEA